MDIEALMNSITNASNRVGAISRQAESIQQRANQRIARAAASIEDKADLTKLPKAEDVLKEARS